MEFVKSLPDAEVYASIPKQMKDAAAAWSAKDGEQSPALETRPIKAERESDRTSKINSISRLLTVFAVADYDYPPPSFKTDAADRARVTAITKMFKMTGDHGVNIDRATIKTRVEDAFKVPPVEELESLAQRAKQTIGDLK